MLQLRSAGGRVPAGPAPAAPPPGGIIERGAQEPRVDCPGLARACSRCPPCLCPPPEPASPMERPVPSRLVPLPLLLLSSLSLLAARGRGAPGPRPRTRSPPRPQAPWKFAAPDAPERALHPGVIARSPELRGIQAHDPPPQYFRLGSNALLTRGTCFKSLTFQTDPPAGSRSRVLCW